MRALRLKNVQRNYCCTWKRFRNEISCSRNFAAAKSATCTRESAIARDTQKDKKASRNCEYGKGKGVQKIAERGQ